MVLILTVDIFEQPTKTTKPIFGLINCRTQEISCVRQLIKPNIVYKDTAGMTNHMITKPITITHTKTIDRNMF